MHCSKVPIQQSLSTLLRAFTSAGLDASSFADATFRNSALLRRARAGVLGLCGRILSMVSKLDAMQLVLSDQSRRSQAAQIIALRNNTFSPLQHTIYLSTRVGLTPWLRLFA